MFTDTFRSARCLLPALLCLYSSACLAADAVPGIGVHVSEAQLTPDFWIAQLAEPDNVAMPAKLITTQNGNLVASDKTMHDLAALPTRLSATQVQAWINDLASPPERELYDTDGQVMSRPALDGIVENRNLAAIPASQPTRYGLVVRRANLRTFPTTERVFSSPDGSDIDRFQESALFPATPVVPVHESADGKWWFVISPRYAAWVEKRFVAIGTAEQVFGYSEHPDYRVVTGAMAHTVFTPEEPAVSGVQLDMGVRVPRLPDSGVINGQNAYSSHVIALPVRNSDGSLRITPALLPKTADTADDYLPLTRANVIQQGFKFLGERYGWGHSYNARDCSGFVSEVYHSMGVQMPRNTSAQAASPGLSHQLFDADDGRDVRMRAVAGLAIGDLVYIPGHVMMVIGRIDGEPWIIHDTTGITYKAQSGELVRVPLNAVSVTPLLPLQFNEEQTFIDRMTSIVRIIPDTAKDTSAAL